MKEEDEAWAALLAPAAATFAARHSDRCLTVSAPLANYLDTSLNTSVSIRGE